MRRMHNFLPAEIPEIELNVTAILRYCESIDIDSLGLWFGFVE